MGGHDGPGWTDKSRDGLLRRFLSACEAVSVERLRRHHVVVPYRAAMGTLDVVFTIGFGVFAALHSTIGVAMLLRSRHQPDAILWRRRRLVAPRFAGCTLLFIGLTFATMASSDVLFETGSNGDGLMILASTAFTAAAIVAGVMWLLRRGRTAQHPTSPR